MEEVSSPNDMVGREASPTAGVIDSQTVRTPMAEQRGCDAGKKIVGRKRHIAVDTDGRLLAVNLTTADISDGAGAQTILDAIRKRWPLMKHFFADGAYDRRPLLDKAAFLDFVVEVVRRTDTDPGFKVIRRRWVVERSFGWMTRYRRLVRDYEQRLDVSKAMIFLAMEICSFVASLIHDILKRTLSALDRAARPPLDGARARGRKCLQERRRRQG